MKKMVKDFDEGLLPDSEAEHINIYRSRLKYLNFKAPYPFKNLYEWFLQLRTTLAHEYPISFKDIKAFEDVRKIELSNWHIDYLLRWDKIYYRESSKD